MGTPQPIRDHLALILAALNLPGDFSDFHLIAKKLSLAVNRTEKPWKAKYIYSLHRGHKGINASDEIIRAIQILGELLDDVPQGIAGVKSYEILSTQEIPPGVLLPEGASIEQCNYPGCRMRFIKTHPNQHYHNKQCQIKAAKLRRRKS